MEVKQFSQGQFADTFEGSAADLMASLPKDATPPTTTVTPPVIPGTPAVDPKKEEVKDPLKSETTLDEGRDAAALLKGDETKGDDAPPGGTPPADDAAAKAAAKKGRPVEKLDDGAKKLFNTLVSEKVLFGFEDGKIETVKDVQDLLDANLTHRIEAQQKEIYEGVFQSMTPAMQMVAQYASQVTHPSELLPLLQTTSNAERFASLDPENIAHQEIIVRERMRMNGDSDAIIDQEITDLKDRNKMAEKAKAYKPVLQQFYERQTQQLLHEKQREEQEMIQQVQLNDQHIRKILDAPDMGGIKLKNNHKAAVYEMLAIPREEYGGGVGIYHIIDQLFQEGKFDRLAKIALLVADEKGFDEAYITKLRMQNADDTIRKLNTSNKAAGPTVTDDQQDQDNDQPKLRRPSRTGFGFASTK